MKNIFKIEKMKSIPTHGLEQCVNLEKGTFYIFEMNKKYAKNHIKMSFCGFCAMPLSSKQKAINHFWRKHRCIVSMDHKFKYQGVIYAKELLILSNHERRPFL
jgi:hypothetical protein